jgi:hypothetical protein
MLYLEKLESDWLMIKTVLSQKIDFEFSKEEREWIEKPFPMILITEQEDSIRMFHFLSREFRTKKNCQMFLGNQISLIATDNADNQRKLEEYVAKHDLDVHVVLFSELKVGSGPAAVSKSEALHPCLRSHLPADLPANIVMGYLYSNHHAGSSKKYSLARSTKADVFSSSAAAVVPKSKTL